MGGDCDDTTAAVAPGKVEVCNGVDDNCDDVIDPEDTNGCSTFFADADGDSFGNGNDFKCLCKAAYPYTAQKPGDCNDNVPSAFPGAPEICNGIDDNCDTQVDEGVTGGGSCTTTSQFGTCAGTMACDAGNGLVCNAPFAVQEECDGLDNDCDGIVDEADATGCTVYYTDKDGDGVGGNASQCLCKAADPYTAEETGDCNDLNPFVTPGKPESCNGQDDDCDNIIDPPDSIKCDNYYKDADKDGWGDSDDGQCLCAKDGDYTAEKGGDCNDDGVTVYPGAAEICNGDDDNCNGAIDEGAGGGAPCATNNELGTCTGFIICSPAGDLICSAPEAEAEVCDGADNDCDGVIDEGLTGQACTSENDFGTCTGKIVCNDAGTTSCDAPEPAAEACDGADNDCNGVVDEGQDLAGCKVFYLDGDKDGFGAADTQCLCGPTGKYTAEAGGDCADSDASVHPDADEFCNGVDDNCKGGVDEDTGGASCTNTNQFGTCTGTLGCQGEDGLVCSAVEPAAETCDGADNDCDGSVDEGTGGAPCQNTNNIGTCSGNMVCDGNGGGLVCGAPEPAAETCDGNDNNCNGAVDEEGATNCTTYYFDADGDSFGTTASKCLCAPDGLYKATVSGDCNDTAKTVNPNETEACNGIDDNCKDGTDEFGAFGCTDFYKDADKDGYGDFNDKACACEETGLYTSQAGSDCDDDDETVFPNAPEICDGKEQACGKGVDVSCDVDGDDYCNSLLPIVGTPAVCPKGGGDCNDNDGLINPAGVEACDLADNNCNGEIDEGVAAPCGGCGDSCSLVEDFDSVNTTLGDGATINDNGAIEIDVEATSLSMLWVANSGEGTVSKLDTETGKEVARYIVGANPSRTAVDSAGNCWVGNRGDGTLTQIKRQQFDCIDKNGDGTIQTSEDLDDNGIINGAELMPAGTDECIGWAVKPQGNDVARAVTVDAESHVWVGYWNSRMLHRVSASSGTTIASVQMTSTGRPYGMAFDHKRDLYVSLRAGGTSQLGRIPTDNGIGTPKYYDVPADSYGIAVDGNGIVWLAGGSKQRVFWFNPADESVNLMLLPSLGNARGITATQDGDVFVARHTWTCQNKNTARWITKIDGNTKTIVGSYDLGVKAGPIGVAMGFGGTLWSINQCTSTVTKMNAEDGEILGEFPVGNAPYTYSDMSGYQLKAIVAPNGTFSQIYEGWGTGTTHWLEVAITATVPAQTGYEVFVRAANTKIALSQASSKSLGIVPISASSPFDISTLGINGRYMQVSVVLFSDVPKQTPILDKIEVKVEHLP